MNPEKKIVLVHKWFTPGVPEFPLGLASLAAWLRKYHGFTNTGIISSDGDLVWKVVRERPDLVGFYAYTTQYPAIEETARRIRKEIGADIPFVLGGPHVSSLPEELQPVFNAGVRGEGEKTFAELAEGFLGNRSLALEDVKGICFHRNGQVVITPDREPIADLDTLPNPDRSLFDRRLLTAPGDYLYRYQKVRSIDVFTVRGCPFTCTYCQQPTFGRHVRLHSADYVAGEVARIWQEYRPDAISFSDDLFTINKPRLRELTVLLRQKKLLGRIRFRADARANLVDGELVRILLELGVDSVSLGLESGSDRVLAAIKGREITTAKNWRAIEMLNRAGIGIYGCFMIGAPSETWEDMLATRDFILRFIRNHRFNRFNINPLTPLPKTKIWDECRADGSIGDRIPWEQFDFGLAAFQKRTYNICRHVPLPRITGMLAELYRVRRRYHYTRMLRYQPLELIRQVIGRIRDRGMFR